MIHIGFTGTRFGMTPQQRMRLIVEIEKRVNLEDGVTGHHGDCVGADAQFHEIVRMFPFNCLVGHLPTNESDRAFCTFDEERAPLPYMKRNAEIVKASPIMFATPNEMEEQERGGTWRTIGMARKARRDLVIVLPDGSIMNPGCGRGAGER